MIGKLIQIALHKKGTKKNLGIFLGFPDKYATQRVNKIIENQNFKMEILKKLLAAAEVEAYLEMAIAAEHDKIFAK